MSRPIWVRLEIENGSAAAFGKALLEASEAITSHENRSIVGNFKLVTDDGQRELVRWSTDDPEETT